MKKLLIFGFLVSSVYSLSQSIIPIEYAVGGTDYVLPTQPTLTSPKNLPANISPYTTEYEFYVYKVGSTFYNNYTINGNNYGTSSSVKLVKLKASVDNSSVDEGLPTNTVSADNAIDPHYSLPLIVAGTGVTTVVGGITGFIYSYWAYPGLFFGSYLVPKSNNYNTGFYNVQVSSILATTPITLRFLVFSANYDFLRRHNFGTWKFEEISTDIVYNISAVTPGTFNNKGPFCYSQTSNEEMLDLYNGSDKSGWSFSGNGVSGTKFIPNNASVGNNTITATKTYAGGYVKTNTFTMSVSSYDATDYLEPYPIYPNSSGYYTVCKSSSNTIVDFKKFLRPAYKDLGFVFKDGGDQTDIYGNYFFPNSESIDGYIGSLGLQPTEFDYSSFGFEGLVVKATLPGANLCRTELFFEIKITKGDGVISATPIIPKTFCQSSGTKTTSINSSVGGGIWNLSVNGVVTNPSSYLSTVTGKNTTFNFATLGSGTFNLAYIATVSGCVNSSNIVTINVTSAPGVYAGVDETYCYNDILTLTSYDLFAQDVVPSKTTSGVNWLVNPPAISPSIISLPSIFGNLYPTTGKNVYYDYVEGSCAGTDSRFINIKFSPKKPIATKTVYTVCSGLNVTLSVSVPGINGTTYWYAQDPRYVGTITAFNTGTILGLTSVTGSRFIYVRSEYNGCKSAIETISLVVYENPILDVGPTKYVCKNDPIFNLNTLDISPLGGNWSGTGIISNIFSFTGLNPGTYTGIYTYTDNNSCVSSASKKLILAANPVVSITANLSICGSALPYNLNDASVTPLGGVWNGFAVQANKLYPSIYTFGYDLSSNIIYANYVIPTSIDYTYTNSISGCATKASRTLYVLPFPITPTVAGVALCSSGSVTLTANGINPYVYQNDTYKWYTNSSLTGIFSTGRLYTTGFLTNNFGYWLTSSNSYGCVSLPYKGDVKINAITSIYLPSDTSICNNSAAINLNNWVGTYTGNFTSTITGAITLNSLNISSLSPATIPIKFDYVNQYNCTTSKALNVHIDEYPIVVQSSDTTICKNSSTLLLPKYGYNGAWNGTGVLGESYLVPNELVDPVTPLSYVVKVGVCENTTTRNYILAENPSAPVVISDVTKTSFCKDEKINLSVSNSTIPGVTYRWYSTQSTIPVSTNSTFKVNVNQNITYSIEAISDNGCASDKTQFPIVMNNFSATINSDKVFYGFGDPMTFTADVKGDKVKSYEWTIGNDFITSSPKASKYSYDTGNVDVKVKLVSENGCVFQQSKKAFVRSEGLEFKQFLAINDTLSNVLSIHPNPFSSIITISKKGRNSFTITNLNGEAIRKGNFDNEILIELENYPVGLYILSINGQSHYKLIKQ